MDAHTSLIPDGMLSTLQRSGQAPERDRIHSIDTGSNGSFGVDQLHGRLHG